MSNRFSCDFNKQADYNQLDYYADGFLGLHYVLVIAHYFFYCAQPLATSASIQNVKTNLREYYVKRLKINYLVRNYQNSAVYIMVFVLNVPDNYVPGTFRTLMDLPGHKIPECVLYYDLIKASNLNNGSSSADIRIDIKKPFKILPGYKLAFVYYLFNRTQSIISEGTAEVFFEVN